MDVQLLLFVTYRSVCPIRNELNVDQFCRSIMIDKIELVWAALLLKLSTVARAAHVSPVRKGQNSHLRERLRQQRSCKNIISRGIFSDAFLFAKNSVLSLVNKDHSVWWLGVDEPVPPSMPVVSGLQPPFYGAPLARSFFILRKIFSTACKDPLRQVIDNCRNASRLRKSVSNR